MEWIGRAMIPQLALKAQPFVSGALLGLHRKSAGKWGEAGPGRFG
jgi:hypothetical protein